MIESMQDSFTNELYIMSKKHIEKIAQDNFDITLHIKTCVKSYSIRFKESIDNIEQKYYIKIGKAKLASLSKSTTTKVGTTSTSMNRSTTSKMAT